MEMQDYRGVVAGSVPVHLSRRGAIGLLCAAISTAPGAVASEPAGGKAGTCSSCGGRVDTHAHYLPPAYRAAVADAGLKTVDGGVTHARMDG